MSETATLEPRVARLETLAENTHDTLLRIERRIEDLDSKIETGRSDVRADIIRLDSKIDAFRSEAHSDIARLGERLGATEQGQAAMSAKLELLTNRIVARLPSWWQIPAVLGASAAVLAALYAAAQFLRLHGWWPA